MSPDTRQKIISDMLNKGTLNVGIAPITAEHINRVEFFLLKRDVLKQNENPAERKQRTVKSIVKIWTSKYLKMNDRDWDNIQIKSITLTDNSDIAFINCATQEDAKQFTSRANNIPHDSSDNAPCLVMYIHRRAARRHKAIALIAKSIRNQSNNTVQTTIRVGKKDFLLRQRPKGSSTPWAEIPPIAISQELPEFEVRIFNDIVHPENNINDDLKQLKMNFQIYQ